MLCLYDYNMAAPACQALFSPPQQFDFGFPNEPRPCRWKSMGEGNMGKRTYRYNKLTLPYMNLLQNPIY